MMSKSTYISLLLAGVVLSCGDEVASEKKSISKSYLVSSEMVSTTPLTDLKNLAVFSGQHAIVDLVKYGVATYRIVYETTFNGTPIQASGLLYVPEDLSAPAPLITLQHGTTFLKNNAPSEGGGFSGMEYFAAAGYIAIMPDFIGYGSSAEIFHPYYDRQHAASAVIDMIKSCKEFLQQSNILFNEKLFMAGYSEGGYVTLAAARELDLNPAHNLTVTAVAAGAGGYDLEHMLESITTNQFYTYPAYLAFVLMAYNTTYDWNKPLTYFFQEKYASVLPQYMNGKYDGWQINAKLTSEVGKLLNPEFLSGLREPEGEPLLKKALRENSVTGWKTDVPIQLFHGTRDEIIPASNSEVTLENFKRAGSDQVTLTIIPNGTHGNSFVAMLQQFVPWFETYRN